MERPFEEGQLIVPNNNIKHAFYYWFSRVDLFDDTSYRVASSTERIYYEKYIKSAMDRITTIQDYKSKKQKSISEATKKSKNPNGRF